MNLRLSTSPRPAVGSPVTPLLRAVLLADLVDSTAFIQNFGDARAAVALQQLDLKIRDLLVFTSGRLIDKADGLLAIFERPVQAVDFALRYQQALREFSSSEGSTLAARVGIHVGEVMTWNNTDSAVAAGAKPLEVEGLAKPVAARLMSLALPGQILLSSMAQSLAQRAEAELGERNGVIRWLLHGRYRFKGVPAPLLVHEVGELGIAPLRAPPSGQKVWRELPIWRRPPVLAAEVLLFLTVGGFYAYTALRSPPALAFHQRDWVVVGDLSNFTGDPRLEDSLQSALRIGLEQSRYVNVIPELKVQAVLQRMGRSQRATVDRASGSEIAIREGARAVLLPTVTEVGGRLRVSVEVVDPNSQATIFAESAEGRGAESALGSLDVVNGALREKFGESLGEIKTHSAPLSQVTTSNLDALRAYSLAVKAGHSSKIAEALALYEYALKLDPGFAMARLGVAKVRFRNGELRLSKALAQQAALDRQRISEREGLELDAFIGRFGPTSKLLPKCRLWATLYPDSFAAYYGYSFGAMTSHDYADALAFLTPALSAKNPARGNAYYLQGVILLALDRYRDAQAAFEQADSMGVAGEKMEFAETFAAQRDYANATRVLNSQTKGGMASADLRLNRDEPIFLLDRGRWAEATDALRGLEKHAHTVAPAQALGLHGALLTLDSYAGKIQPAQWREFVAGQGNFVRSGDEQQRDAALFPLLSGAWLAARNGDTTTANSALALAKLRASLGEDPSLTSMQAVVEAEVALASHQPKLAITVLRARHDGRELYFSHSVLMRAYVANGNVPAALAEADWLARERGRAFAEDGWTDLDMWSAANVVESNLALLDAAEFAAKLGQGKLAQNKFASFLSAWPNAERIPFLQPRLKLLRARLQTNAQALALKTS